MVVSLPLSVDVLEKPSVEPVSSQYGLAAPGEFDPLSAHQLEAAMKVWEWLKSDAKVFTLTGFAGTGKTYSTACIIRALLRCYPDLNIGVGAISNKATSVIHKALISAGCSTVSPATVARLLGLKCKINKETGQEEFSPDPRADRSIESYDLVIIDESSQIGQDIWRQLVKASMGSIFGPKLWLVGDPAQLRPVNEGPSQTFGLPPEFMAHLSEVQRYSGPLAVLAEQIRDRSSGWVEHLHVPTEHTEDMTKGTWSLNRADWLKLAARAITAGDDLDSARIVAYTNARCAELNGYIRRELYGDESPRFIPGMPLIATRPYIVDKEVVFRKSEEMTVVNAWEGRAGQFKTWTLDLNLHLDDSYVTCFVIHEDSMDFVSDELQKLARAKRWRDYWAIINDFAWVDYPWALTSHSAQGSTFGDVFVDLMDMKKLRHQRPEEFLELSYVGATRGKNRGFFVTQEGGF